MIARAPTSSGSLRILPVMWRSGRCSCATLRPGFAAASAITTRTVAPDTTAHGAPRPTCSARKPQKTGPAMPPTPATVMTVPSAAERRTSEAESPIHARPADQIVPDASPNAARVTSRSAKPDAAAVPAVESAMSTPAASVTRLDPSRSDRRPAGIDAITIASGAAESSAPASVVERS